MSDKNETLLIEIYKEQVASWKHEDNILYKFGAVLLPVSFIALGIPYVKVIEEPTLTILEIISTTGENKFLVCSGQSVETQRRKDPEKRSHH